MDRSSDSPAPLKALELQGYKTFASNTVFEFGRTITAIVGPNGSGKSNIADAVRWVLGEQSYSLLRGKKTEDMIFAGSESRPRASMASATITFDNSQGWLPIDFAEVSISRRAYRDGQNEYLLNGQKVRLREVSELLAQVGLAQRTYTIIGQGLVDAALSLKAEERRRLFEEAAGIGLYRSRREEALKRMESTQRNLERVQDILAELRPRLRSLERQAQRAREYEQVKTDLEAGLRVWYGYHWHHMGRVVAGSRDEAVRCTEIRDGLRARLTATEGNLAETRTRIDILRSSLHQLSQQVTGLYAQRESLGTRLAVSQERLRWLGEQDAQAQQEIGALEESRSSLQARLETARGETAVRLQTLSEADEAVRMAGTVEGGPEPMARLGAAEKALEALAARQASWSARRGQLEERGRELARRRSEVQGALDTAGTSAVEAMAQAESSRRSAAEALRQRESAVAAEATERGHLEQAEREATRLGQRLGDLRGQVAGLEARLEVLGRQEAEAEEATLRLLQAAERGQLAGIVGRLSQQLRVPAAYETAILAALGEFGDGLALQTAEDVSAALDHLDGEQPQAQAALLPVTALRGIPERLRLEGCLGNAAELTGAEPPVRPVVDLLLGRTLIVQDRAAARRLLGSLPEDARLVTLSGEVFHPAGHVLVGGRHRRSIDRAKARSRAEGLLAAARTELAKVETEEARARAEVERRKVMSAQARQASLAPSEAERVAQRELAEAEAVSRAAAAQRQTFAAQLRQIEDEVSRLDVELQQSEGAEASFAAERTGLESELRIASEALRATEAGGAAFLEAQARERLDAAKQALEEARSREAEAAERLAQAERDLAVRDARLQSAATEQEALRQAAAQAGQAMQGIETRLAEIATQTQPAEIAVEKAEHERAESEAVERQLRTEVQAAERDHSQAQIELARRQEEMNSLKRRIEDDFGLVSFDFDEETTGQTPLPLEGLVERLPVVEALPLEVESQVERLRAQLRRMGAVNPEAQREYVEVRERVEFLTAQVDDLRKAESQLQEVIAELDLLMEREFRKTFDAVAVAFRETFTQLFGGGVARLRLTDPEDLTTTGIDIEARLPGRREQGLAMLSGGERSLTACALVFALLKVSPTPICLLDEVDAMLDEANVARFRELLRSLSSRTQFIIITHNRETIQAAEVVYGVTMGRDSASTVISLKLDEAAKQFSG